MKLTVVDYKCRSSTLSRSIDSLLSQPIDASGLQPSEFLLVALVYQTDVQVCSV